MWDKISSGFWAQNVDFKTLTSFYETIFSALMNKQEQLTANGQEFTVLLAELSLWQYL